MAASLVTEAIEALAAPVRLAKCGCGVEAPSSYKLPFFKSHAEGTGEAEDICKCGYHRVAHEYDASRVSKEPIVCRVGGFAKRGDRGFDSFYCGCRGWD